MLDKMLSEYKDLAELQEYASAQFKTIVDQSKKIQQLEAEVSHLKGMLGSTVPIIGAMSVDDEETIARHQLMRLKEASMGRELTLEEARKLEIYSKVINQIENRPKKNVIPTKALSNDDLLKQLDAATE